MAQFAVHLRMTPGDYYALTVAEHRVIVTEWNKTQKRRG